jgi:Tfp pilus assembly protein PilN
MINLIPHTARRTVQRQYWQRALTVQVWLLAAALLIVLVLQFPSYVLLQTLTNAYSNQAAEASADNDTYRSLRATVADTNNLASQLLTPADTFQYAESIAQFDAEAGTAVSLTRVNIQPLSADAPRTIQLAGIAATRTDLADFRTNLEALPYVDTVELPIANLAAERDISFNLTLTLVATGL